jgi:ribosomal protein L11
MAKKIIGFIKLQIPAGKANHRPRSALHWVSAV